MTTDHSVLLTGLQSCTIYYYSVTSADLPRNSVTESRGGLYFYFETLGDFGQGPQGCHGGRVSIDNGSYACNASVGLQLTDIDLNRNSAVSETAVVMLTSSTETTPELITLTETGANTSRFTGAILTTSAAPTADGRISVQHGDTITVTYLDDDDGTGLGTTNFDTALADCVGPEISDLRVDTITDQRATIRWTTSEPGDTVVEWGLTPALGNAITSPGLVSDHAVLINRFDTCNTLHFRVRSTDVYGNQRVGDVQGTPHTFRANNIPGLYYRQTFENGSHGWTLQGEWQVGTPQGLGNTDPSVAYNNTGVLGHDLTGLGTSTGNYESNLSNQSAVSPTLNATTWANTKVLFYRQLNVEPNDDAALWVFSPQGLPIYRSSGTNVFESGYSAQSIDIRSLVDGRPAVRFEFKQSSDSNNNLGGWNVDDFIVKNGNLPDYGPCGGCGTAPSFAGASSAVDNNACGASGVTVSWKNAASWGSGAQGSYSVYRGAAAGFTPNASNRVATGVTGLSFNDTTAPAGTWHYLVRAENDETCSSGPANGGVTDSNASYLPVVETTSRPVPGVVSGLMAELVGKAHLRLRWNPATDASGYRVYRSTTGQPGSFSLVGSTSALLYDDHNQGNDSFTYFYLVKGTNPCGQEGP
jgi:hypothetical protein